jgi:aspartate/methionine/tyrosine aminotransferase
LLENYPILQGWLAAHADSFTHIPPRAGAIAWAGIRRGWNSAETAEELRAQKGVLIVPGEQLGMEEFVRFGYGGDPDILRRALTRVGEWMKDKGVAVEAR